jgi:hypothetical protein
LPQGIKMEQFFAYLWGCPVAKRFWTSFNIWLSSALDLEAFEITPKETW